MTLNKSGDIEIERMTFDGRRISGAADNVELLPGRHDFELHFRFENDNDCAANDPLCFATAVIGVCEGSITTQAGRTYLLTIELKYALVDLHVSAKGYFDFTERADEPSPGAGSCRTLSEHEIIVP